MRKVVISTPIVMAILEDAKEQLETLINALADGPEVVVEDSNAQALREVHEAARQKREAKREGCDVRH